jgi:hypothetical protein
MAARENAVNSPSPTSSSDDSDFVSPAPKCHHGQQGAGPSNPHHKWIPRHRTRYLNRNRYTCHFKPFVISTYQTLFSIHLHCLTKCCECTILFWYCNYVNTFVTLTRFINYSLRRGVIQILLYALHHCSTHSRKRS